ncbi:DNA/RNA non-specific endonuclease [Arthrobacter sp. CAN_A1]|uniref:DNA/RNA non-specific endonuclease n=1 Tax=Arthrobacter sp. CAN_A1 TaxID=2787717 RepID=UPI0018CAB9E0
MEALLPEPLPAADYSDRKGFDDQFLGLGVPIPALNGAETTLLPYTNFSVLLRGDKRLAAVTALGIDGAKLMLLEDFDASWRLDPRLPDEGQTGAKLYVNNDIDRGHLARRASAVWGDDEAQAVQANEDTYHYTNAAPQAAKFNQSRELWLGLETYLLDNAADNGRRLIVFTGPIFAEDNPSYRGTDIPLRYFKVAAFLVDGELASTGYVVDQTPLIEDLPDVGRRATDDAPPLGPFRTFQVPIRDIATLTGLDLAQLIEVDRMPIARTLQGAPVTSAWREIVNEDCLDLDFDLKG